MSEPAPSDSALIATQIVLCVLTINQGRLAVLATRNNAANAWGLPGGPAVGDVSCDDAAEELLRLHEPQRHTTFLEQLRTYGPWSVPGDAPVLSVAYVALVAEFHAKSQPGWARVFALDDLAGSGFLPVEQEHILADGVERVRAKFEYTTAATSLVVEPFTIPELRRVYESVWGVALHPANFRRKVLTTSGFVERVVSVDSDRGPELYRRGTALLLHPAMLRPNETPAG